MFNWQTLNVSGCNDNDSMTVALVALVAVAVSVRTGDSGGNKDQGSPSFPKHSQNAAKCSFPLTPPYPLKKWTQD